jgi:predicted DNA-binding transcriptional regulator YafY
MRADRLLSMLMILQVRGRATAARLAQELEVSERTVYRDVVALSAAGVPVYTDRGPGGGIALLDSYRTTLTGLTGDEIRALFMLSVPAPLVELGVSQELKAALRKLAAALPASYRSEEVRARQRIHLDSRPWNLQLGAIPSWLATVQQAVWHNQRLWLAYRSFYDARIEIELEPYGLVAKAETWYLVGKRADHLHVIRVSQIVEALILAESFAYPEDFDLPQFWSAWCAAAERNRPAYLVVIRVAPGLAEHLPAALTRRSLGMHVTGVNKDDLYPDEQGWRRLELKFESFEEARSQLLAYGRAVEVLEPQALRLSLVDFAQQIVNFYRSQRN